MALQKLINYYNYTRVVVVVVGGGGGGVHALLLKVPTTVIKFHVVGFMFSINEDLTKCNLC